MKRSFQALGTLNEKGAENESPAPKEKEMTITIAIVSFFIVFGFTTVLTIAGVGAAFIIIPAFFWLGVPLKEAMATALLIERDQHVLCLHHVHQQPAGGFRNGGPHHYRGERPFPLRGLYHNLFPAEYCFCGFSWLS